MSYQTDLDAIVPPIGLYTYTLRVPSTNICSGHFVLTDGSTTAPYLLNPTSTRKTLLELYRTAISNPLADFPINSINFTTTVVSSNITINFNGTLSGTVAPHDLNLGIVATDNFRLGNPYIPNAPIVNLTTVTTGLVTTTTSILKDTRSQLLIYNEGPDYVYIKYGTAANTSVYSVRLLSGETLQVPSTYKGVISGVCATTYAKLKYTEFS